MLPVTHGVAHTSRRIVQYCVALLAVSLLPWLLGASGWLYALGAVALGLRFLAWAWRLQADAALALPTFRFSIVYLAALFTLLLADHALL
jgi:protoheme IX farnesyltransferase